MKYHMETEKAIIQNNKKQRIFELLKHKYSLFFYQYIDKQLLI